MIAVECKFDSTLDQICSFIFYPNQFSKFLFYYNNILTQNFSYVLVEEAN